ncbi:hypothetical protein STCU_12311 [Strigomonas culicis]|uniref:Uncharacterized protein n=1 Tax=Strigomonas culicis TaxID=28005 RepID=S9TDY5_9TRYP|nr:hypothetical protein STCU_12311 [Strigomonas culicis]|eukprot:EPY15149.1 hypothetical protein STCU_12311 [Strigomonas culicis]
MAARIGKTLKCMFWNTPNSSSSMEVFGTVVRAPAATAGRCTARHGARHPAMATARKAETPHTDTRRIFFKLLFIYVVNLYV